MSKIPKIGFASCSKSKENVFTRPEPPMTKKPSDSNLGFKKPSDDNRVPQSAASGRSKENTRPEPPMTKKPSGSNLGLKKRPSDDNLLSNGKRCKTNFGSVVSQVNNGKYNGFSNVQQSNLQEKLAAKRAPFQPIPDTGIRSSMPAVVSAARIPGRPKRPVWDLKGRIQDMEENFQTTHQRNLALTQELEAYNQRIVALEAVNSNLNHDVEIKSVQSEEASARLRQLDAELKQKTEEYDIAMRELNSLRVEANALRDSVATLTGMKAGLQAQLDATELLNQNLRRENDHFRSLCSNKDQMIESQLQQILSMEAKEREGESLRRILHNELLELKGNIRVFCRLRPPLPDEQRNGMIAANIVPLTERSIEIQQMADTSSSEIGVKMHPKYEFSFDCYFSPISTQEKVFQEISQLVQSALDGYNVCIFAYGQTGSGKTFTMEGPAEIVDFVADKNHPKLGVIPRSVQHVFDSIADLELKGWKYKVETLFLEIYNERIQDLLNPKSGNTKCEIVKSGNKGTDCVISNVTASEVTSAEEVYGLMKKARINRVVAATKCNEYSSRSHYVFQMKIYGENSITTEKCEATLNLVDLAGSERVKESASAGDRLTEAKSINKSLSNLGKVIMSLSQKDNHIPYRDSKLTHLLANSLGGNSKTLMFVNISPDNKSLNESINSLRFATKVNQCNIGTAHKRRK